MDDQAGRRAGGEEGEIVKVRRRRDRDEALDLRPAHQELHADPGAEGEPGDPAAAAASVCTVCTQSSAAAASDSSPEPWSNVALAAADAAEIEAQHRKAALREHVEELIDDLVVHRAAELRVRMEDDGDRARSCVLAGWKRPSRRPAGPVKMTSGIGKRDSCARRSRGRRLPGGGHDLTPGR